MWRVKTMKCSWGWNFETTSQFRIFSPSPPPLPPSSTPHLPLEMKPWCLIRLGQAKTLALIITQITFLYQVHTFSDQFQQINFPIIIWMLLNSHWWKIPLCNGSMINLCNLKGRRWKHFLECFPFHISSSPFLRKITCFPFVQDIQWNTFDL